MPPMIKKKEIFYNLYKFMKIKLTMEKQEIKFRKNLKIIIQI